MAVRLSEIERKYFVRKLGLDLPATTPLNEIKIRYWTNFVGGFTPYTPFNDMEYAWQMKVLADAGLTEPEDGFGDVWKVMVSSIGKTPSKYANQNMLTFYLNAP